MTVEVAGSVGMPSLIFRHDEQDGHDLTHTEDAEDAEIFREDVGDDR